jgi:hypothetical protein
MISATVLKPCCVATILKSLLKGSSVREALSKTVSLSMLLCLDKYTQFRIENSN